MTLQSPFPVVQLIENHQGHLLAITGALDVDLGYVGDGVFYSDDGGKSWANRNNGLGIYKSCEKIAIDSKGRLYLGMADEYVTGNGGLFISENNGLLWEHINISINGKNTVPDNIKVGNTFGLSVSPEDSVYLSITGTAVNAFVSLNLKKSINDIRNHSFWSPYKVFNSVSWWLDRTLSNIHFAKNGDWYSSTRGTINTGTTYFSGDKSQNWLMMNSGLGLDIYGFRNIQHFAEDQNGKIFMVQVWDENVYHTTNSLVTDVEKPHKDDHTLMFPNPAFGGERISMLFAIETGNKEVSVLDLFGRKISTQYVSDDSVEISAPRQPGHYLVVVHTKRFRGRYRLIVR
ncbi:hypothetical protein C900_01469 [Fulvivirga imtechensis AK7]|uniref:Secretion system C-terminal sorting domain-containing protein n=1 Tax=Fulvivirga imtechensis AK7 TaxID=1237149 RepID=L8JXV8_9BACT|nr:hypothetical protein C900_01469 [Fulvivirga imtechensis AK7]